MASKIFAADIKRLDDVIAFVEGLLEKQKCPDKDVSAIDVALEEIFVNVAHYAYPDAQGEAEIVATPVDGGIEISIIDEGIPFNPLAKADPDTTLYAKERKIGGLGIYMVKQMMDKVSYERKDGKNILSMIKFF